MKLINATLAAAFVLAAAFAGSSSALADAQNAICYFGGQSYSTGARICSNGDILECNKEGNWSFASGNSPSCVGKPNGSTPGDTSPESVSPVAPTALDTDDERAVCCKVCTGAEPVCTYKTLSASHCSAAGTPIDDTFCASPQ